MSQKNEERERASVPVLCWRGCCRQPPVPWLLLRAIALAELHRASAEAADEENRPEACRALLTLIAENAPIVPVCFEKHEVCAHRGVVGGFSPTQYNIFHDFANWTIDLS